MSLFDRDKLPSKCKHEFQHGACIWCNRPCLEAAHYPQPEAPNTLTADARLHASEGTECR